MAYLSNALGDANNLGFFATPAALAAAYPVGAPGYFAIVGTTNTIWIWNGSAWADSGAPGSSAFVYIAYASDASGTNFTNTFDSTLNYIAIKTTTVQIPSPVVGDFAGLWKNYKGAMTWKDAYAGGTSYIINDAVSYLGSTYICILASTGNLPTNGTYWNLVAQKGADGAGSGDVNGPASAVDSNFAAFNTTTGKLIKDSGKKASDFQVAGTYATGTGTANGTNTGDNATNSQYSGLASSKQDNITLTTTGTSGAATLVGATLNIPQYTAGGGGDVIGPATNTADYIPQWNGANSKTLKDGLAVPAGGLAGITALGTKLDSSAFSDAGVTGKLITGFTSGAGAVAATDTILQAINKLNGNIDTKGTGTVTSVAALTLGTTGTDLSSTVATGTTTPVITLNVPTASASNRGVLSSTDWSTFNNKQAALTNPVTGTGTTNEISYWTGAGTQGTLPVATYPSLTELSYVKGVTSAIQTQIGTLATKTGSNWTFASQAIGDIAYATSTTAYGRLAAPVAGKILTSGGVGVAPLYSVPTFPTSASATTRKIIVSDGTNWTASTETYAVPGTSGNVLTSDGTNWTSATPASGGLWTVITATRVGNTSCTVVGDQTAIFKKGMIIRWQESAVDKVAMVSIPSTVSGTTTITFIGDVMANIDANSFKYSKSVSVLKKSFAIAGNIGATATNVANAFYADKPYRVIGAELSVGTAGTTNSTTIDINKNGTTMFTTKPTLATTVAFATTPFTADTTSALALGDKVTIDIDAIQTTNAIDLYADLILLETRFLTLS